MEERGYNLEEVIEGLDPAALDYEGWLQVGMALKDSGYSCSVWESWSCRDSARYHEGECEKKWKSFQGSAKPITAGTIVQMARDSGWTPSLPDGEDYALDWDSVIGERDEKIIIDPTWVEGKEITEPQSWDPVKDLVTYLETLFEAGENVGYVCESWEKEGRYLPTRGSCSRTAGQLIQDLTKHNEIGAALGDYKSEAGAWIRFNPLDGKDVKNENVTEFRFALVESDSMDIEKQHAIISELELPVATLVHSGNKSLHAIVRVDAKDYDEYRKRVDYLYEICRKNGLALDTQNKNPSRLSRMPGATRNGAKQFLVATNIGRESWKDWYEWTETVNDDLPEPESMASVWDNLPELSPPLVDGVLRQGHKMLLAGPSKAGKSYALIELCCAIAEGADWFGFSCTQGRVMYVNLELDKASCLHRFKDVYTSLDLNPNNLDNIDIWNLRGKAVPMDKLAPKLIRRAAKKNYIAIVIDPIYKVITGDENSADQMAHFCNQFDKVCTELGCAVIYCHHHSKGSQGQKRSMDRASGSGVFARDPDAMLDLIELELTEDVIKQQQEAAVCAALEGFMDEFGPTGWKDQVPEDDLLMAGLFEGHCQKLLAGNQGAQTAALDTARIAREEKFTTSAWRIEGTLREFPRFAPVNLWFEYPIHRKDDTGILSDLESEGEGNLWRGKSGKDRRKKTDAERRKERKEALETAFESCGFDDDYSLKAIAGFMGVTEKTVRNRIKEHPDFLIAEGLIVRKPNARH